VSIDDEVLCKDGKYHYEDTRHLANDKNDTGSKISAWVWSLRCEESHTKHAETTLTTLVTVCNTFLQYMSSGLRYIWLRRFSYKKPFPSSNTTISTNLKIERERERGRGRGGGEREGGEGEEREREERRS